MKISQGVIDSLEIWQELHSVADNSLHQSKCLGWSTETHCGPWDLDHLRLNSGPATTSSLCLFIARPQTDLSQGLRHSALYTLRSWDWDWDGENVKTKMDFHAIMLFFFFRAQFLIQYNIVY